MKTCDVGVTLAPLTFQIVKCCTVTDLEKHAIFIRVIIFYSVNIVTLQNVS